MSITEILKSNLTDEQYAAVIDESKNILCLACAGSGKSRTLAYKIAYLVSQGINPDSMLRSHLQKRLQIPSKDVLQKLYINLDFLKTILEQCLSVQSIHFAKSCLVI